MKELEIERPKLSFIDENNIELKRVENIDELRKLVAECRETGGVLAGYDFSNLKEISCVCLDNMVLENIVFSRFCPCEKERPLLFQLSFLGASLTNVSFAQARLCQCNFDKMNKSANKKYQETFEGNSNVKKEEPVEKDTTLEKVDFFFTELEYCRFRQTQAKYVDFRYSKIANCTLSEFQVEKGDFYFCNFSGCTSFIDSKFTLCSFTCASFENVCIRMSNLNGIVQENEKVYHGDFLFNESLLWNRYNPCSSFSSMNHKECSLKSQIFIASEAMNFYRQMSGIYAGKGLNRDSNEAYKEKVLKDRKYCKLLIQYFQSEEYKNGKKKKTEKVNLEEKGLWYYRFRYWKTFLTQFLGYGYKWWVPCLWFLGLVAIYWGIYQFTDKYVCFETPEWLQHIGYSLNNALSPFSEYYKVVSIVVSSIQSTIGVLLVGFLGFVIANKIRNDS